METVAVLVLNYKRQVNITDNILPGLISNSLVSTIIIAHGLHETVFGLDHKLEDEEIFRSGKVLHIGDFKANDTFCCWRRWKLIKKLKDQDILKETYIHSQDDDLLFDNSTISNLLNAYKEGKGILISATPSRNIDKGKYIFKNIKGSCNITLGQSIFTRVDIICKAVERADSLKIPNNILKCCDDICLSFLSLDNLSDYREPRHYSVECKYKGLKSNDAVSSKANWAEIRNNALSFMINLAKKPRLILSTSIGNLRNFIELTSTFMKVYAKKISADLIIIKDSDPLLGILDTIKYTTGRNNNNVYVLKIKFIFYYLNYYRDILWLDDTCIIKPDTCDLFNYINNNHIVGFNEGCLPFVNSSKYDKKFIQDKMNFSINDLNYINSGVVLYNEAIQKYLSDEYINKYKDLFNSVYPQQAYLNYIIQFYKIPCGFLEEKFNKIFILPDSKRNMVVEDISKELIYNSENFIYHITGYYKNRYDILEHICSLIDSKN